MKAKSIILPFLIVAIAGCKDKRMAVKPKCPVIPIDTVYQVQKPCLNCGGEIIAMATGSTDISTGCEIEHTQYITIYFNPIINHSKI